MTPGKAWTMVLLLSSLILTYSLASAEVQYDDDQWALVLTIRQHARVYEVSESTMIRVANCESTMGSKLQGDWDPALRRYRSHGPYQLNDRDTGLVWHFYEVGYTDPYDFNQAVDYYARVLRGEWRQQGVVAARWSCR